MLSNSTGAPEQEGSGYPFHTFPESKWESVNSVLSLVSMIGLISFAVLHYIHDPYLTSLRRLRAIIGVVVAIYIVPFSLIMGSRNDEAMISLLVGSTLIEIVLNVCLFHKNPKHKIYTRFGSRALFVSMCVLIGASMATDEYNRIDYYGPVRVTDVNLEAYRPEQQVDKYNPQYYYYYQLVQTLEWGDSWGCPIQKNESWCSANEDLYKKKCSVRIDCEGRPANNGIVGECATAERKEKAYTTLFLCWAKAAQNDGLGLHDFMNKNFTRTVAPWDDPSTPHTVTRSVSCDKTCRAQNAAPEQLAEEALWYWIAGGLISIMGLTTLLWGTKHDKEVQPIVFQPVPARIVMRTTPASEVSAANDVELASNMPVARAVPA